MRVNRTYSLDYDTIKELNDQVSAKYRSRFVDKAIKNQLKGWESIDMTLIDTKRLYAILHHRDDVSNEIKALLLMELTK